MTKNILVLFCFIGFISCQQKAALDKKITATCEKIIVQDTTDTNIHNFCSTEKGYKVIFETINGKIVEDNSIFYTNDRGTTFLYLTNSLIKKLEQNSVLKIEFNINNTIYVATPIDQFFSRERPSSDFVYGVNNQTKTLVIDTIEDKKFIVIVSEKSSIESLINDGSIKAKKLEK